MLTRSAADRTTATKKLCNRTTNTYRLPSFTGSRCSGRSFIHVDGSLLLIAALASARHATARIAAASSALNAPRTRIQPCSRKWSWADTLRTAN